MSKLFCITFVLSLLTCISSFGTVIEDFEDVSDWSLTVGSAADSGSIGTSAPEAQVGSFAGQLDYSVTTAVGFDFVRFSKIVDIGGLQDSSTFSFHVKQPNDPDSYVSMSLITDTGGFYFADLAEGDGTWGVQNLVLGTDFGISGTPGTTLTEVRFVVIGDLSTTASADTLYLDQMEITVVPEASTLCFLGLGSLVLYLFRRRSIVAVK